MGAVKAKLSKSQGRLLKDVIKFSPTLEVGGGSLLTFVAPTKL